MVISLTNIGEIGLELKKNNIKTHNLNLQKNMFFFIKVFRLIKLIRNNKPELVQTWMFHANVIGGFFAKLCGVKKIYWNFRHSNLKFRHSKFSTIFIDFILRLFSFIIPQKVITCSKNSILYYKNKYNKKLQYYYIPNGYDYSSSKNETYSYNDLEKTPLRIGMLANFRSQKNFEGLFLSLFYLKKKTPKFKCYLAGENVNKNNKYIINLIKIHELEKNVILLGKIDNTKILFDKIDLHILSSTFGEAFPNSIAESMLNGIPNVSNDVGDASIIIGNEGWVLNENTPINLSNKIIDAYNFKINNPKKWLLLKKKCTEKIKNNYSIEKMVNNYINAWNA